MSSENCDEDKLMMVYELVDTEKDLLMQRAIDRARADLNDGKPLTEMQRDAETEAEKTPREIAQLFLDKWEIFASPLDALELLIKGRDERAAKIVQSFGTEIHFENADVDDAVSAIRGKS